jgi:preprotein translocase subunit YajC
MPIMMMVIFAIFYFIVMMPQRKKQKKHMEEVQNLTPGKQIITAGGIVGTVVGFKKDDRLGDLIELKIASNTNIAITKSAVGRIVNASEKTEIK